MKWACLISTAFSFVIGALGHAQLVRHGITTLPVVLTGLVALACVAVVLLVAHHSRGIPELLIRYPSEPSRSQPRTRGRIDR